MVPAERLIIEDTAVEPPPEDEEESMFLDPIEGEDEEIDEDYTNDGGGRC